MRDGGEKDRYPPLRVDKITEGLEYHLGKVIEYRSKGGFVEPVKLVKVTPRRRLPPEPELVMIMPADPYRGRIRFVPRTPRPRTLLGRVRSLRRALAVWWGGTWKSRWAWCWSCRERVPNRKLPYKIAPFCEACNSRPWWL